MYTATYQDGTMVEVLEPHERGLAGLAPPVGSDDLTELGFSLKKFISRNANSIGVVAQVVQVAAPIVGSIIPGVGTLAGIAISGALATASKYALSKVMPPPQGAEADPETGVVVGATVIIAPVGRGLPVGLTLPAEAQKQDLGDGRTAWVLPPGKSVPENYKWPEGTQAHRTAKGSNVVLLPSLPPAPLAATKPAPPKPAPKPPTPAATAGAGLGIAAVAVVGLVLLSRSKR